MCPHPFFRWICLLTALGCILACGSSGGGTTPTPQPSYATKLHYTGHPSATPDTWRVEVDSGNDTMHLVLKVCGPAGTSLKGTAFFLAAPPTHVVWGNPGGSDPYLKAGSIFNLTQGPTASAQLFKSKVDAASGTLQAGLFQKSGTATLNQGVEPVAYVALDLKPSVRADMVALGATAGKQAIYLDTTGKTQNLNLLVGTLQAQ